MPLLRSNENDNQDTFNNDDYGDFDVEVNNHKWIFVFSRHDKITKKDKITSEFALSRDCEKSPIASSAGRKGGEVRVQLSLVIIHQDGEEERGEDEEVDEDDNDLGYR